MRVALFFDGKNFYAGWKDATQGAEIDFSKLARWVVSICGGTHLVGAYYYTGVDDSPNRPPAAAKLESFLEMLADQPGYFVQRFQQKLRTYVCPQCNAPHTESRDKEVDTTIVADMLRLAAVGAFDLAVLVSGDADLVPAVVGVRELGKVVLVASWGTQGLSKRLMGAAFNHIDLTIGLDEFSRRNGGGAAPPAPPPAGQDLAAYEAGCLDEIRRGLAAMPAGYLGAHFFINRWRSRQMPEHPDLRRQLLERLVTQGKVELYLAEDGVQAIRLTKGAEGR